MTDIVTEAEAPTLLFKGAEWDFEVLGRVHDAVEEIARTELGLDTYTNRIEVISSEQMLDAYASVGLPLYYKHWSFGKQFSRHETLYRKGYQGLAYEIVINSEPCISYVMEENSAMMQTLVIAHAAFGHNHFFKNNYLFRQWTDAGGILSYLEFAKAYVADCEDRYGEAAVERLLDSAHALMGQAVHRYPRKRIPDLNSESRREQERRDHQEKVFNDLWRTLPASSKPKARKPDEDRRRALLELPQENILYFLEKNAPRLAPWQREILRIVRLIAQYLYPQGQTKVMNEGCATFVHHRIMTRLHEKGLIDDGAFLEFATVHANVILQPDFDDPRFSGINPYALGFAMMTDIERIVVNPTEEDRQWFPEIAGTGDAYKVLRQIWADYRDESFIAQFLSPRLIRDLRLFNLVDDTSSPKMRVEAIHDEHGYRQVRRALARSYDTARRDPDIQVVDVDLAGDRRLVLHHRVQDGATLEPGEAEKVLHHLAELWSYDVVMKEIDSVTEEVVGEHTGKPLG
jgi:spore cortex formation protein SpoVR/YcgB (stage V sporulation)